MPRLARPRWRRWAVSPSPSRSRSSPAPSLTSRRSKPTSSPTLARSAGAGWVDLTTDPEIRGIHYFTGEPVAASKNSTDLCYVELASGHRLTVNRVTQTAQLKMSGIFHPFYKENPTLDAATRRKLHEHRRVMRRGAFLSTGGAFKMKSSSMRGCNT